MEDRLQKVLEKKKVKNNYKHIEVLPTLDDNSNINTSTSMKIPKKPSSPNSTNSTQTVKTEENYPSINNDEKIENPELVNSKEDVIVEPFGGSKGKGEKLRIRVKKTLTNIPKNSFLIFPIIAFIVYVLFKLKIISTYNNKEGISDLLKNKKFVGIVLSMTILFGIALSYDDGSRKKNDKLSWNNLKTFQGWRQLLLSITDFISVSFTYVAELLFLMVRGDDKFLNNDIKWIRRSTFEFFSIPMSYFLTKYLYFSEDSTAQSYYPFNNEYVPLPITYFFLLFSHAGPIIVYKVFKTILPQFMKKIGVEDGYIKFILYFIIGVIMVYTAIPFFLSCVVNTFKWKTSPLVYYLIGIGFLLYLIPDQRVKLLPMSEHPILFILLLLFLLVVALIFAPFTQILLVAYFIYYFANITVKDHPNGTDGGLNNVIFNNTITSSPNSPDTYFSIKPENVQMTAENAEVPNFIWWCYLLFFLWKVVELIGGYIKKDTILRGVKSDGCFSVFLAVTILAIIIMIGMASMRTGVKTTSSTINAVTSLVGNVAVPVGKSLNQPFEKPIKQTNDLEI